MKIPFLDLARETRTLRKEMEAAASHVLDRGRFILDAEVEAFEREWARFCGASAAVGVGNGTQALEIALRAIVLKPGDEVITTPLTAAFTGLAILAAGGTPVFADVDKDTLLLDPEAAASKITARTRAIIPVHLYGRVANLRAFGALARKHGLEIIQDACQAHGATWAGKPLSDFSRAVAYSFYPTKNLGALGDGGALVTNDLGLEAAARVLRNGGMGASGASERPAINSRLDELQAAFLRVKLSSLGEWNRARRALAAEYALHGFPPVGGMTAAAGEHVFHLYVILEERRKALCAALAKRGIGYAVHYPLPLHLQPAFAGCAAAGSLPVAEAACRQIVSLPLNPFLSHDEVGEVCRAIADFRSGKLRATSR